MLTFQNHHKQMKAPFLIYADFEALIKKISLCERQDKEKSFTVKTEHHEARAYSYTVVRSDGEVLGPKVYRGINAVGTFFREILQEEEKIRESLAAPKPIVMEPEDWEKFKSVTDCLICSKSLIKDDFLDSLPVWSIEGGEGGEGGENCSYKGQGHKKCFYKAQNEQQQKWVVLRLKKVDRQKRPAESKNAGKLCVMWEPFTPEKLQ